MPYWVSNSGIKFMYSKNFFKEIFLFVLRLAKTKQSPSFLFLSNIQTKNGLPRKSQLYKNIRRKKLQAGFQNTSYYHEKKY